MAGALDDEAATGKVGERARQVEAVAVTAFDGYPVGIGVEAWSFVADVDRDPVAQRPHSDGDCASAVPQCVADKHIENLLHRRLWGPDFRQRRVNGHLEVATLLEVGSLPALANGVPDSVEIEDSRDDLRFGENEEFFDDLL